LAQSSVVGYTQPRIRQGRGGVVTTIAHRELFSSVSTGTYATGIVGPQTANFPWVSEICQNWETYEFVKLRFIYVPSVAATQGGMLTMAMDTDPTDTAPATTGALMSWDGVVTTPLWQGATLEVPPRMLRYATGLHRFTDAPVDPDALHYVGTLVFHTDPGATPAGCGYIMVEYVLNLFTPQVNEEEDVQALQIEPETKSAPLFEGAPGSDVSPGQLQPLGVPSSSGAGLPLESGSSELGGSVDNRHNERPHNQYNHVHAAGSILPQLKGKRH
jgi:hypothetical protein